MQWIVTFAEHVPSLVTAQLGVKLVCGSAIFFLYLFFLEVMRDRMAGVAGMLLTFPTLNGIGLLFAQTPDAAAKASNMMPMIPLNGVLFLLCTTVLIRSLVSADQRNSALLKCIITIVVLLAALLAWGMAASREYSISNWYAQIAVIAGALLLALVFVPYVYRQVVATPQLHERTVRAEIGSFFRNSGTWARVAAFAIVLFFVLCFADPRSGADRALVGTVSALPLPGFFGLLLAATASTGTIERVGRLRSTVLFGPVIATSFVFVFSRIVDFVPGPIGFGVLLLLWGLSFFGIVAIDRALRRFQV